VGQKEKKSGRVQVARKGYGQFVESRWLKTAGTKKVAVNKQDKLQGWSKAEKAEGRLYGFSRKNPSGLANTRVHRGGDGRRNRRFKGRSEKKNPTEKKGGSDHFAHIATKRL